MPRWQEHRDRAFPVGSILLIAYDTPKFETFTPLFEELFRIDNTQWMIMERARQTRELDKEVQS